MSCSIGMHDKRTYVTLFQITNFDRQQNASGTNIMQNIVIIHIRLAFYLYFGVCVSLENMKTTECSKVRRKVFVQSYLVLCLCVCVSRCFLLVAGGKALGILLFYPHFGRKSERRSCRAVEREKKKGAHLKEKLLSKWLL